MPAVTFLRIAFVLAIVQYAAHARLFLSASPRHGQDERDLVAAMKSGRWNFGGFTRSYWDFYFGYGLLAIMWGVIEIALLWALTTVAGAQTASLTALIVILLAANVGHAVLTLRYFFLIPAIFDVIISIVLVAALVAA